MKILNRDAMLIPKEKLADELLARIEEKNLLLKKRDAEYGADRVRIYSYLENIALPGLFGFDMNDYYANSEMAVEIELRSRIFWLDNSHDDGNASLDMHAGTMYYDMTLFGIEIKYQSDGVPLYQPHSLMEKADMSLLKPFDFYSTGEMPAVHKRYEDYKNISRTMYGDKISVHFPSSNRGPLDIYVQLRGYENFIDDTYNNPQFIRELLSYITEERFRYNKEAAKMKNETINYSYISDDWLVVPFISPGIFEEYFIPAYLKIQENEGPLIGHHTCGAFEPFVPILLKTFPTMTALGVSGWNDWELLDELVDPKISFQLAMINTFVLFSGEEEQRQKMRLASKIARRRPVGICVGAIVKTHDTFDESIERMNRFIDLSREVLRG